MYNFLVGGSSQYVTHWRVNLKKEIIDRIMTNIFTYLYCPYIESFNIILATVTVNKYYRNSSKIKIVKIQ